MNKQPLVSIVIPCYNYGQFLGSAIESGLAQSYAPIEIIVVDDGSTDNTATIAAKYQGRVRYIKKPNGGLSSARNHGAKEARGEFVVFLDADDVLEPSYVEECLKLISGQPKIAYVYTQMRLFGRQNEVTRYPDFDLKELRKGNYINASALIHTDLVRKFPYDETLKTGWEDWDFYLTLATHGYFGKLLNKPLLRYRKHEQKTSMIDALTRDWRFERDLMHRVIDKHASLFGPTAKLEVSTKFWLRAHAPWLVPGLKKLVGRA